MYTSSGALSKSPVSGWECDKRPAASSFRGRDTAIRGNPFPISLLMARPMADKHYLVPSGLGIDTDVV